MSKEEKILDIVKKLFEKTEANGASFEEAQAAVAKAQELLAKYNLSMSDLREENDVISGSVSVGTKTVSTMQWMMASELSAHFGIRVFKSVGFSGSRIVMVGEKSKVAVFEETYKFSYNHFQKVWKKYCASLDMETSIKNVVRGSYFKGYVDGLTNELIKSENANAIVLSVSSETDEYIKNNFNLHRVSLNPIRSFGKIGAYDDGYREGAFGQRNKHTSIDEA